MALWEFVSSDDAPEVPTIRGDAFRQLMEICFARADRFSMNTVPFRERHFETEQWFCYAGTWPPLRVNVYRACPETLELVMTELDDLFLGRHDPPSFCSLEDLCFFRKGKLFFGTVTHEFMCYAHVEDPEFGNALKALGPWEENAENSLANLEL